MKNVTIHTICYDDVEFVELDDLLSAFDAIHLEKGRPDGDDLDQQMTAMMIQLAMMYDINYVDAGDDCFLFYPKDMDESEVLDAYRAGSQDE